MKKQQKFFQLIPSDTKIDFIRWYRPFVFFSLAMIALSIGLMSTKGFNFGIDFTGGTVMQIKLKSPMTIEDVRKYVTESGASEASVVAMDKTGHEYLITAQQGTSESKGQGLVDALRQKIGPANLEIPQADIVGPKVGNELKWSAVLALFYSVLLIMIYIWFRFDFKFAPGATAALIHDLILVSGFYVVTGMEFDITAVAALLTIAGYSVNDTIVIYDRVRSMAGNTNDLDGAALAKTVNSAINLTLSRTILTAGCTALSVLPVAIFCDGPIQAFAQAVLFGIFVGCYSTIYIAAPMTITVNKWTQFKTGKKTRPAGKKA